MVALYFSRSRRPTSVLIGSGAAAGLAGCCAESVVAAVAMARPSRIRFMRAVYLRPVRWRNAAVVLALGIWSSTLQPLRLGAQSSADLLNGQVLQRLDIDLHTADWAKL